MQFRVTSLESVSSTNDVIKRAIEAGEPEGLAVRALRQTAGYGRQGRAWESPIGGMYQSFLLRPDVPFAQLPTLSLLVGLAVRRAVAGLVPELAERVQVKWPNDLVIAWDADARANAGAGAVAGGCSAGVEPESGMAGVAAGASSSDCPPGAGFEGGAFSVAADAMAAGLSSSASPESDPSVPRPFLKLGGISTEVHAKALCVGVGINVARPEGAAEQVAPSVKNIPVHLDELGYCEGAVEQRIAAVADALCAQLGELYPRWCAEGFAPFQAEFDAHAALTGRFVRMEDLSGNALAAGTVVRTAPDGRLVLRAADGTEIFANSGEAHIRS